MSKRALFLLLFSAFLGVTAVQAKRIQVLLKNNVFYAPETGTYLETDILITAQSVQFVKKENGKFKATVEMMLLVKKGDVIVAVDKSLLHSTELNDTSSFQMSLIDKKRFTIEPGTYTMEATFKDVNVNSQPFTEIEPITIFFDPGKISISDISLVDSYHQTREKNIYVRNGYYMAPYVDNFYPKNNDRFIFYAEIYNANHLPDSQFLVNTFIKKQTQNVAVGNLSSYRKMNAAPVNVVFSEFDITGLQSGDYHLVLEVRDRKNELLAYKELFFQRSNPLEADSLDALSKIFVENTFVESMNADVMDYQLKSITPIASADEARQIKELLKSGELVDKKRFFLYFWMSRNPADPKSDWEKYSLLVKMVNDNYGTPIRYGFDSDRGRVYLRYGPPSDILESPREPGALPYEIWVYNMLKNGQTNVKFVFYNPDLVTNEYKLIHSTADGEIKNEHWQRMVYEPFVGGNRPTESGTEIRDHYGSKATDYFKKE